MFQLQFGLRNETANRVIKNVDSEFFLMKCYSVEKEMA